MTETGGDKGRFSVSSTPKETKRKETVLRLLHTKGDKKEGNGSPSPPHQRRQKDKTGNKEPSPISFPANKKTGGNMTFSEIFKSSFLSNVTAVSMFDMVLALVLAFGLGVFIYLIYKKTYAGVMYSSSFGVTLVALTMITALVILAVTSNVVLSLGMVGALSIVRFRTAIKEPLDIAFLLWSIAAGIVLAAGMIPLAVFGSVLIGLIILFFANRKENTNPYIIVLECSGHDSEQKAVAFLKEKTSKCTVKSKTARKGSVELNLEIRLRDDNTDFVNQLSELEGVGSAVLVSYNGDYIG